MSDDSFIREVEEELRSDRLKGFWDRFGTYIIAAAVIVVIATAAWTGYEYYTESRANASGDRFLAALNLANEGKSDEALAALQKLEADGYGAYPVLARMRAATVLQDKGDAAGAVAAFDAVAADTSAPQAVRDMANIRAAYILVDTGSATDVAERAEALSSDEIRCAMPRARPSALPPGRTAASAMPGRCSSRSPTIRSRPVTPSSAPRSCLI